MYLHGEVDDAQSEALLPLAQNLFDGAEAAAPAQARAPTADAHRYVRRRSPRLLSRNVRNTRARSLRFPPGALALPTPATELHCKLLHPPSPPPIRDNKL
jgi:hypothetical protein